MENAVRSHAAGEGGGDGAAGRGWSLGKVVLEMHDPAQTWGRGRCRLPREAGGRDISETGQWVLC